VTTGLPGTPRVRLIQGLVEARVTTLRDPGRPARLFPGCLAVWTWSVYHKKLLERTITLVAHPRATLRRRPGPTKATRNGPQGGCRACDGGGGDGRCRALEAAIASPARVEPAQASELAPDALKGPEGVRGAATSARRASRGGERDEARGGGRWAAVGLEATALSTAGLGAAAGARAPYVRRVGGLG
jgi:hypothetical protein